MGKSSVINVDPQHHPDPKTFVCNEIDRIMKSCAEPTIKAENIARLIREHHGADAAAFWIVMHVLRGHS